MSPIHIDALRAAYSTGSLNPVDMIRAIYARLEASHHEPVFISLVPKEKALDMASALQKRKIEDAPLYGVPFAIKDNIDLQGLPTTAGCPEFAYSPDRSAPCVEKLIQAGAIPIGKTNLDQFATGLVGTRTPYGACSSVFSARHISGGSSSGSAVAVARGLVTFALGTDTAGSGRVPAAFNNIIGLKPTRGRISTLGVVPACQSLDAVSVFAMTAHDAEQVLRAMDGARTRQPGEGAAPWLKSDLRFGVPKPDQLEFFGDAEGPALFERAARELAAAGGTRVEIDFAPFQQVAQLLYSGPWVAERYAAVGRFIEEHAGAINPTVGSIVRGAAALGAADAFRGMYRLEELRGKAAEQWRNVDVLLLPTAPRTYTIDEVNADPVRLNSNLGYYTNFVNLLDLAAVAVPAGFNSGGLPFGVTLIGPAFTDEALLAVADKLHRGSTNEIGATQVSLNSTPALSTGASRCVEVAVVGAHLSGQPLNHQLTSRGGRLVRACRTARDYRLYALSGTVPPKPGLVREPGFDGPGIELEVWALPEHQFGSFVREVPPPLGIGTAVLDDRSAVKCFICEPWALTQATEITAFGGWRRYLAERAASAAQ